MAEVQGYGGELRSTGWRLWLARRRYPLLWFLALLIGIAVGYVAIGFRLAITTVSHLLWGAGEESLGSAVEALPWTTILLTTVAGGLIIGLYRHFFFREETQSVAEVIEARAMHGGRIDLPVALKSAVLSAGSLGVGASAGREGPIVHLGAALAARLARFMQYPVPVARTLLGCGAAAAVSASFNAPLAGVLFALEVILGHYALRSFAPITIASVAGAVVAKIHLGDMPAFVVPEHEFGSFLQMPAFFVLGIVSAGVAMALMVSIMRVKDTLNRVAMPEWLRPALGGLALGLIGIFFPHALGVGYEATDMAIREEFALPVLLSLILAKIVATAVTLGSRFGGGVFSPSLVLGAMTGGAFGMLLSEFFPEIAGHGFYAMVGMGAVAAAVLGAPISTTLIVFELTLDYNSAIALLLAGSVATVIVQTVLGHSFFQWQLERKGIDLRTGVHLTLQETILVRRFMSPVAARRPLKEEEPYLRRSSTMRAALEALELNETETLPVVDEDGKTVIGEVKYDRVLKAYNDALVAAHIEEHR